MKKNFDPSSKSYVPSSLSGNSNNNNTNTNNNRKPVVVVRKNNNNINNSNSNYIDNKTKPEITIKTNNNNNNNYREPKNEKSKNNSNKNKPSSKKNQISANHLLQFNFKREEQEQTKNNNNYSYYNKNQRKHIPVFNKKRYVEANYSFVLKNMDRFFLDSNKNNFVDWENVEQVILFSHEKIKCPICLEKPVVPKITKCGHIYCWTCILRYITEFEAKRGCPVCSDNSTFWKGEKELKSIDIIKSIKINEGEKIRMRLLAREINSNVILPFDRFSSMDSVERTIILNCEDENSKYNRYTFATPIYLKKLLKREFDSLQKLLEEINSNKELSTLFIEQAISQLNDRREQNNFHFPFSDPNYLTEEELKPKILTSSSSSSSLNKKQSNPILIDSNNDNNNNNNFNSKNKSNSKSFEFSVSPISNNFLPNSPPLDEQPIENLNVESWDSVENPSSLHPILNSEPKTIQINNSNESSDKNVSSNYEFKTVQTFSKSPSKSSSKNKNKLVEINIENGIDFFYQSEDGSPVYLHPFNDKCIYHQFQNFSNAPLFIEGRVLEIFPEEQNNEKHVKHLNHIPLSAHLKLVELDLFQNKTLSYQTKNEFYDEFRFRENKRKKKKQMIINEKKQEEINILELQRKNEKEIEELCKKFPSFRETMEESETYCEFPEQTIPTQRVDFVNRDDKRTPYFDENDFQYSSYASIASKKNENKNNNKTNNITNSKSPIKQKNIPSTSPSKSKTNVPLSSSPIEELSDLSFDLGKAVEKAKSNQKSKKKNNKTVISLTNGPNYKI